MARIIAAWAVAIATLTNQASVPESDRYIKLGTRIPEVPAGQGGELRIAAETQWCRDPHDIIEVRLTKRSGSMPVVRLLTHLSDCTWTFPGLPVGLYDVVIVSPEDDRIVANGRGFLPRGTTTLITVESAQTEIEGRLTSPQPLPSPLRLRLTVGPSHQWTTRVAEDGTYHVRVSDVGERTTLAVWAEADDTDPSHSTVAFNAFSLMMTTISRGLVRLDLEKVKLPPVVLHVEVPPVPDARFDEFAEASLDGARGPGFKLLNGLRSQALAEYGAHTIRVLTNDRTRVLATTAVTVGPAETEARVVLNARTR